MLSFDISKVVLGKTVEVDAAAKIAVETSEKVGDDSAIRVEKIGTVIEDVPEISGESLEHSSARDFLNSKLDEVKFSTPEQLESTMEENLRMGNNSESRTDQERVNTREGLTDEEKDRLKDETGWSEKIVDGIGSIEEAEIYKNVGLVEAHIGQKECLIRPDIDWKQKDQFGRTNAERAKQGLAPLNSDGQPLELHHIGQHNDSPLAELSMQEHRGKGNDTILHDKTKESEIDRPAFGNERAEHWRERAVAEGVNNNE